MPHIVIRWPKSESPTPTLLSSRPIWMAQHVKGALFQCDLLSASGLSAGVFMGFPINEALEIFGARHPRERLVNRVAELEGPDLVGLSQHPFGGVTLRDVRGGGQGAIEPPAPCV
jgi:hypothetical protein